jgi:hypothetical protein
MVQSEDQGKYKYFINKIHLQKLVSSVKRALHLYLSLEIQSNQFNTLNYIKEKIIYILIQSHTRGLLHSVVNTLSLKAKVQIV